MRAQETPMKIYQYWQEGKLRLAVNNGRVTIDALAAMAATRQLTDDETSALADTVSLIRSGTLGEDLTGHALQMAEAGSADVLDINALRLAAPISATGLLCSGSNYQDHVAEKANTDISGKEPEFFVKPADCVIGPRDDIQWSPRLTRKLDAETELAIVMGKPGRDIPVERALDHVYGYTIVNDLTARDLQVRFRADGSVWYEVGRGKVFDCSAPLGPCIVTRDEIPDPQVLQLRTKVNGELRQNSSTSNMIFSCAHIVHFFSLSMTLKPGIVLITGTPSGTAWSADVELGGKWKASNGIVKAKGYLQDGDVIECDIERIGTLRSKVVAI
jgi:2-keto-4-pentenoate hydratase/2-oxohepta-3-ene-1,7-dioic acid hydratase in catechol pathway